MRQQQHATLTNYSLLTTATIVDVVIQAVIHQTIINYYLVVCVRSIVRNEKTHIVTFGLSRSIWSAWFCTCTRTVGYEYGYYYSYRGSRFIGGTSKPEGLNIMKACRAHAPQNNTEEAPRILSPLQTNTQKIARRIIIFEHTIADTTIQEQRRKKMVKGKPKTDGESPDTKVTFDEVTIYEFPVDIGDNPAVREGCPIRLGDRLLRKSTIDVESYEKERSSARQRHAKKLYIDVTERATM